MRPFPTGFKRYDRVHPRVVLDFIADEIADGRGSDLGDYESLSQFDLNDHTCYLITCDSRNVGFLTVRFYNNFENCWASHLFIRSDFRRRGCASFVLKSLKVNRVGVIADNEVAQQFYKSLGFVSDLTGEVRGKRINMVCAAASEARKKNARLKPASR